MLDLNIKPYFDDYDEDKNFHRILYRPSFAVQARELTQQQTILQNQIKRFAGHMFKNGSMVLPGNVSYDGKYHYVKLQYNVGTDPVDVHPYLGKTIVGAITGVKAEVINVSERELNEDGTYDPPTLFVKYKSTGQRQKMTYARVVDDEGRDALDVNGDQIFQEVFYDVFYDKFIDGEKITIENEDMYFCYVAAENVGEQGVINDVDDDLFTATGEGCSATIESGCYYINGFFVNVQKQTIIIDKYLNVPTCRVGLRLYDTIVTHEVDSSLTDNAQGSYNYAAPGADRYKLTLKLEWTPYSPDDFTDTDSVTTEEGDNFIMLMTIVNGEVSFQVQNSEYAELERNLARRTYDESGDYTVTPFLLTVYEHLRDETNMKYVNGRWTATNTAIPGDKNKLALQLSSGKAYVKGFERAKVGPTWLELPKARDVQYINNETVGFNIGNYCYVTRVFQLPDLEKMPLIYFFNDDITVDGDQAHSIPVGSARVRAIELDASSGIDPANYVYKLYLFDTKIGVPWTWIHSAASASDSSTKAFTCSMDIDFNNYPIYSSLAYQLHDQSRRPSLIRLPEKYVATMNVGGVGENSNDTSYTIQKMLNISYDSSVARRYIEIDVNEGESYDITPNKWLVQRMASNNARESFVRVSKVTISDSGDVVTVEFDQDVVGGVRVLCPVSVSKTEPKKKILRHFNHDMADASMRGELIDLQSHPEYAETGRVPLSKCDGESFIMAWAVKDTSWEEAKVTNAHLDPKFFDTSTCMDVSDRFVFNGGQTDTAYKNAYLELKPGYKMPQTPMRVMYTYYEHQSGGDYFNVDSYYYLKEAGSTDIVKMDWEDIPHFVSEDFGDIPLADCLDFRPTIVNENGNEYIRNSSSVLYPNSHIRFDYQIYLSRIDKIYIDTKGKFGIAMGIPAKNPEPPDTPADAMLLYRLHLSPYTPNLGAVKKEYIDNKRFTMRDIGKLETRIENLEYYVTLSMLEIQTLQMQITDGNGNNRYKNGFIVDPFQDHSVGDFGHADYKCSVKEDEQVLLPTFATFFSSMDYVPELSDHVQKTSSLITLPYTSVPYIEQPKANTINNVNPFAVRHFAGVLQFQPDSDLWYDTQKKGTKNVDYSPYYDAIEQMAELHIDGAHYGDWMQTGVTTKTAVVDTKVQKVQSNASDTAHADSGWSSARANTNVNTATVSNLHLSDADSWHDKSVATYKMKPEDYAKVSFEVMTSPGGSSSKTSTAGGASNTQKFSNVRITAGSKEAVAAQASAKLGRQVTVAEIEKNIGGGMHQLAANDPRNTTGQHGYTVLMGGTKTTTGASSQTTTTTTTSPSYATKQLSIGMDLESMVEVSSRVQVDLDLQTKTGLNGQVYSAIASKNVYDGRVESNLESTMIATTTEKTTTTNYARDGKLISHQGTVTTTDIGDRVIGMTDAQYMRELSVLVRATGLKPKTRMYPFFDDKDVIEDCQPLPLVSVDRILLPARFSPTGQNEYGPYFFSDPNDEEWLFPYQELAGCRKSLDEILKDPKYTQADFAQCIFVSYIEEPERETKSRTDKQGNVNEYKVIKRDPSTGQEIKKFVSAQLIIGNWKGARPGVIPETNRLRKGMTLYGVKTGCQCTLLEDPVAPGAAGHIITSDSGQAAFIFNIPANTFRAGERTMVLTDQLTNAYPSQSRATGVFKSMGYNMISEGTTLTTRSVQFAAVPISDSKKESVTDRDTSYELKQNMDISLDATLKTQTRNAMDNSLKLSSALSGKLDVQHTGDVNNSISGKIHASMATIATRGGQTTTSSNTVQTGGSTTKFGDVHYNDPLAQSFVIDMEGGVFITAVDVCFYNKDDSLPIELSILEMENGWPTQRKVPFSTKILYPADITCVTDPEKEPWVWTRFEMEAPVYLPDRTEWAIFLISSSFYYDVWCATIGEKDIRTGTMITNQPYDGVLFKSQNASTWSEDQETDLTFVIERAHFDISKAGEFIATNVQRGLEVGLNDAMETFIGSRYIRIHHPDHGLAVGNDVTINNFAESTKYNGLYGDQINGLRKVLQVEMDSFLVEANKTSKYGNGDNDVITASINGRCAEAFPIYETNIPYDVFEPNISHLIFPSTNIEWAYMYTQGCSVGAPENAREHFGVRSSEFRSMNMMETNKLPTHGAIVCQSNLAKPFDRTENWSLKFQGILTSDMANLSPVIDLDRCGTILVNHRVDYPRLTQSFPRLKFTRGSNQVEVEFIETHIMQDGAMIYLDLSDAEGDLANEMIYDELTGYILASETVENPNASLLPVEDPDKVTSNNTAGLSGIVGRKTEKNMYARDLEKWYVVTRKDDHSVWVTLPGNATESVTFDLAQPQLSSPNAANYNLTGASVFYSTTHYKFVPETMSENNSTCSRYFTKKVTLDKPSTAVRIMFAACCYGAADFEVWLKTKNEYDTRPFNNVEWWRITDESFSRKISKTDDDFKDYECTLEFTTPDGSEEMEAFNSIACKLVMKSANQVELPKFKNLRIVCLGT